MKKFIILLIFIMLMLSLIGCSGIEFGNFTGIIKGDDSENGGSSSDDSENGSPAEEIPNKKTEETPNETPDSNTADKDEESDGKTEDIEKPITSEQMAMQIRELLDKTLQKEVTYREVPSMSEGNIKAVLYTGMPYQGRDTEVFAYLGLPEGASESNKVPAVVLVHGGAQTAYKDWVELWNSKGYAAIAFYWRESDVLYDGLDPEVDYYGGPRKDGYFMDYENPTGDQWMYHAVSDSILANTLLSSLPEVDSDKIGITGISWGGIITSYTMGVDERFKFAIPVYGCGYLQEGTLKKGLNEKQQLWDAKNVIANTKAEILWVNGTTDNHFALDSTAMSYDAGGSASICIENGLRHGVRNGPESIFKFADTVIYGMVILPWIESYTVDGDVAEISFYSPGDIASIKLIYNTTGIKYSSNVSETDWDVITLTELEYDWDSLTYKLPDYIKGFYFEITDSNGGKITTNYIER